MVFEKYAKIEKKYIYYQYFLYFEIFVKKFQLKIPNTN